MRFYIIGQCFYLCRLTRAPGKLRLVQGSALKKKSGTCLGEGEPPLSAWLPRLPEQGRAAPGSAAMREGTHLPPENFGVPKFTWKGPRGTT